MADQDARELVALLRANLDEMSSIAAQMVVLAKFRDVAISHLPPHTVHSLLADFDWALEEALPVGQDWTTRSTYCLSFEGEANRIREALAHQRRNTMTGRRSA